MSAYETETCWECGGAGIDTRDMSDCECCGATGELYTEAAIALQIALEDAHAEALEHRRGGQQENQQ